MVNITKIPTLSIVIPTYNSVRTISESIRSILEQTFEDYEILIMDGLSDDDTLANVRQFNDPRIKIFSEKDSGVYDAMNKGIEKASGKWIYFLGSDDTLYSQQVLSEVVPSFSNHDFVYGKAYFTHRKIIHGREYDRVYLQKIDNICHQAIFYKKELFTRLGNFNLYFKIWADWDFNIRCFSLPDIQCKYINTIICNFNDQGGLSSQIPIDEEFIKLLPLTHKENIIINDFKKNSKEYKLGNKIYNIVTNLKSKF